MRHKEVGLKKRSIRNGPDRGPLEDGEQGMGRKCHLRVLVLFSFFEQKYLDMSQYVMLVLMILAKI